MFPITTFTLLICLMLVQMRDKSTSGLKVVLYAWAFQLLLVVLPLYQFNVAYYFPADLFVAGGLIAQVAGYLAIRKRYISNSSTGVVTARAGSLNHDLNTAIVLSIVGIIGSLLLLVDTDAINLSFSSLWTILPEIRAANFERLEAEARQSLQFIIGSYLSSCSFLSISALAIYHGSGTDIVRSRTRIRLLIFFSIIGQLLLVLVSITVLGGRQLVFCAVLLYIIARYLRDFSYMKLNLKKLVTVVIVSIIAFFSSTAWLVAREGNDFDGEGAARLLHRASFHPAIVPLTEESDTASLFFFSLTYFSSPINTLSYYLQQPDLPGPLWGVYNYPLPARSLGKVLDIREGTDWIAARREVFRPLNNAGEFGNVWPTWLRDLYVDFGYVGTLAYLAAFSAAMAWFRNRFERTGRLHYHLLETLAALTAAFGAFQSLVWFNAIASAFYFSVGLLLVNRMRIGLTALDRRAILVQ